MMDIAVPVIAICLATTTLEVDDKAHSTVAYQSLDACTICNKDECPRPAWMAEAEKLAALLNKAPEQKRKRKDARR